MALSTFSFKFDSNQRHIIMHRLVAAESLNGVPYFSADALRSARMVCPKHCPEPFQAKQLTACIHGFGHAIRKHEQRSTCRQVDAFFIQVRRG
jgi:hypothetical protein